MSGNLGFVNRIIVVCWNKWPDAVAIIVFIFIFKKECYEIRNDFRQCGNG